MKDLNKLPLSKIMPELEEVAKYHGLRLNRADEFKSTVFMLKMLYNNAPWETEEIENYENICKLDNNKGLYVASRVRSSKFYRFLRFFKEFSLRRLFKRKQL